MSRFRFTATLLSGIDCLDRSASFRPDRHELAEFRIVVLSLAVLVFDVSESFIRSFDQKVRSISNRLSAFVSVQCHWQSEGIYELVLRLNRYTNNIL